MRVAITGATGNVGSRVVAHLLELDDLDSIIGVVRRPASGWDPRVHWEPCDIGQPGAESQLRHAFAGVDAVIHLAWQIQPARDRERMRRTNIDGSKRVFGAAFDSGVGAIVYLSSVGT